jgi:MYND finger
MTKPTFGASLAVVEVCCGECNRNIEQERKEKFDALVASAERDAEHTDPETNHPLSPKDQQIYQDFVEATMCPFCFEDCTERDPFSKLLERARTGEEWAQHEAAKAYLTGSGVPMNIQQAEFWCGRAAAQGNLDCQVQSAMHRMHSFSRAEVLPAARQGHALAQYMCGLKAGEQTEEGQMWMTLSAAQGFFPAQGMMGAMHYFEDGGIEKSYPKIFYWSRKAGLKGCVASQGLLYITLLEAKEELFGYPDFVGHSALPETLFWGDLLCKNQERYEIRRGQVAQFLKTDTCACCYATGSNVTVRRCVACKAVGYCGRECQTKHWNMGH